MQVNVNYQIRIYNLFMFKSRFFVCTYFFHSCWLSTVFYVHSRREIEGIGNKILEVESRTQSLRPRPRTQKIQNQGQGPTL